jgi:DnaK suppressor protein
MATPSREAAGMATHLAPDEAARLQARLCRVQDALRARRGGLDAERVTGECSEEIVEPGPDDAARDLTDLLTSTIGDALVAVEVALRRFADGSYGVCASCGHAIPLARLDAVPHAVRCVRCQSKRERSRRG